MVLMYYIRGRTDPILSLLPPLWEKAGYLNGNTSEIF